MSEFRLDKVERKHTQGELGIVPSGNNEEAYTLLDYDRRDILFHIHDGEHERR